ncbi:glucose-6-phosphate dehydrogenase [Candidatus Wolfebacteria bacterium]|nr:glucose-6-phosphate dehydrogenase [Candidatus Wolfebacteria bacterium]
MQQSNDKINAPSILVIFGATGDLAAKKIFPSLWRLFRQGRLPDRFSVIGFSRSKLAPEHFKKLVRDSVEMRGGGVNEYDFSGFFLNFSYHAGVFENEESFSALTEKIAKRENSWGVCANKLFYLAVPPAAYEAIFKNLAAVKLNLPCGGNLGWSRMLIEKPFGADLESARKLQTLLSSYFKEEQLYRIDHYLFKEIVQGMENFRFSNNLFENTWNNATIDRIDIRLHETIGAEDRGNFYDAVGALRDVGQNHIPSMLALLTMDYPEGGADAVRKNRAAILESLAPWNDALLTGRTYRAQYAGYQSIQGVQAHSQTETYFAVETGLTHPRWKGIPIYMEAGKRMAEARKEIVLTLKHPRVCHLCETGPHEPNKIVFRLEPNDEIVIHFWTKKPGFEHVVEERIFSFFLYEKEAKAQYVEEYAKILFAAMEGRQDFFVSTGEIEALWKFTDPIVNGWKRNLVPLAEYKPDTTPRPSFAKEKADTKDIKTDAIAGEIGIIGLGKMGGNLARRLTAKKWKVVGFNKTPEAAREFGKEGVVGAYSIKDFVEKLHTPRIVWLMVPHDAVDAVLEELVPLLEEGDIIVDGGNSFYKDSIRRAKKLKANGIHFLDVGVSGGPVSIQLGKFAIMVGGEKEIYEKSRPIFDAMSDTPSGYMGKSGAGHFAKMIHNGIEYGMMQSLAEGFTILKKSPFKFRLKDVAKVYNQNSIITSRLTGWIEEGFREYGEDLKKASGIVAHTGEGEWTVKTAKALGVSAPAIEDSYLFRVRSKKNPSFTGKILSMLRAVFGGHKI